MSTDVGPVWCHFSELDDTLKLWRFDGTAILDFDAEDVDIEDRIPLPECRKIVPGEKSYSIEKNPSAWHRILDALQTGAALPDARKTEEVSPPLIVPVTRLRRYYSSMKVFDELLLQNLAEYYSKNPVALEVLWNDSRSSSRTTTTLRTSVVVNVRSCLNHPCNSAMFHAPTTLQVS